LLGFWIVAVGNGEIERGGESVEDYGRPLRRTIGEGKSVGRWGWSGVTCSPYGFQNRRRDAKNLYKMGESGESNDLGDFD